MRRRSWGDCLLGKASRGKRAGIIRMEEEVEDTMRNAKRRTTYTLEKNDAMSKSQSLAARGPRGS